MTPDRSTSPVFFARRIILLSGDADAQDALADALSSINPKLAVLSLDAPVYDCLFSLSQPGPGFDAETGEASIDPSAPFPPAPGFSYKEVFDKFYEFLRTSFGEHFLAERALATMGTVETVFDCYAITGLNALPDFEIFHDNFPPDELLHISLNGVLGTESLLTTVHLGAFSPERQLLEAMKAISPKTERRPMQATLN